MNEDEIIPTFMPSLISVLRAQEKQKGAPLTEQEVIDIRDRSTAVMLPLDRSKEIEESRGYKDIDPGHCWQEWQDVRIQLGDEDV